MKNSIFTFLLFFISISLWGQSDGGTLIPLDVNEIQEIIKEVPSVGSANADNKLMVVTLPLPDGSDIDFIVKHAPLVTEDSPLYETTAGRVYSLYGVDKGGYNGSMVLYKDGVHATLNTPSGLLSISRTNEEFVHEYVYFKDTGGFPHSPDDAEYPDALPTDNVNAPHQHSLNEPEHTHDMPDMRNSLANNNFFTIGGGNTRKVLDVFIMSEAGFRNKFSSQSLAEERIVEIINAVKVIFERDMNLTVNYLGVYFKSSAEGSSTGNAKALYNSLSDADVPNGTKADVDVAHLLTGVSGSGAHGAGGIGVACIHSLAEGGDSFNGLKASGYSAAGNPNSSIFPPLVAHELGHQLGGYHTWTGQAGSCTAGQYGNRSGVEPGSGNTMAAYSGICGSDNIPSPGNEDYLHTESIREMATFATSLKLKEPNQNAAPPSVGEIPTIDYTYIGFTGPTQCIASESYANNVPQANSNPNGLSNMNIPARTPFELMGSATDGDDDNLTYQWDQMDFAISQAALDGYATRVDGPLFRSFGSSSSPTRIFPQLSDILAGTQTKGEILPQTNRRMRFACTVRDGKGGVGVDTVSFNVVDGGTGFAINEPVNTDTKGSVTISWEVANTASSPISCANVDIMLSTDGGNTFSTTLIANTANDGSETIVIPAGVNTTQGRIKIKCSTSIFFDISNANLTVMHVPIGGDPCTTTDKMVESDDITPPDADTIRAGGTITTSGTIEVTSGHTVAFLAPTSITLANGFHAQTGSAFTAKIEACVSSIQEEESVVTLYRYNQEMEEVIAIETKSTSVATTLETPAFSKLDLSIAPNPAKDFTNLTFNITKQSTVNMTIYDMSGKAVESMIQGQSMSAGWHQVQYTPQSIKGGMYYVVLQADNEVVTKKMILVR